MKKKIGPQDPPPLEGLPFRLPFPPGGGEPPSVQTNTKANAHLLPWVEQQWGWDVECGQPAAFWEPCGWAMDRTGRESRAGGERRCATQKKQVKKSTPAKKGVSEKAPVTSPCVRNHFVQSGLSHASGGGGVKERAWAGHRWSQRRRGWTPPGEGLARSGPGRGRAGRRGT